MNGSFPAKTLKVNNRRLPSCTARIRYKDAKELGINVSQTCERSIQLGVHVEANRQWAIKYADFIQAYNDTLERGCLLLTRYRTSGNS